MGLRRLDVELVQFTGRDVVRDDDDKVLAIIPALFMPQPQGMANFVGNEKLSDRIRTDRDRHLAAAVPDIICASAGKATGITDREVKIPRLAIPGLETNRDCTRKRVLP